MKPEVPLMPQKRWDPEALGSMEGCPVLVSHCFGPRGLRVRAEPSKELQAVRYHHPNALAFSNVTFAWGFLPASPFCALTSSLTQASAGASGSLGVELFVGCARETVSCRIQRAQMLPSPGRRKGPSPAPM